MQQLFKNKLKIKSKVKKKEGSAQIGKKNYVIIVFFVLAFCELKCEKKRRNLLFATCLSRMKKSILILTSQVLRRSQKSFSEVGAIFTKKKKLSPKKIRQRKGKKIITLNRIRLHIVIIKVF